MIAGKGRYPAILATRIREHALQLRLIALEGESDPALIESFRPEDRVSIKVGQIGKLIKALKMFHAHNALMVGQVTPGRLFKGLHPDFRAFLLLKRLKVRNAASLFGALAAELHSEGITLLDARAFLDSEMAPLGPIVCKHRRIDWDSINYGLKVAQSLAACDVGQGLVVRKGTILAMEGFDGTDGMIEYAGRFPPKGKILIKLAKPNHDFRFDVPVIGERTIRKLHQFGFSHCIIEAGRVLLLERERVESIAKDLRISIVGVETGTL
ncbi:MAG: LpxI family protein [Puniceicoccaceae bacterium]